MVASLGRHCHEDAKQYVTHEKFIFLASLNTAGHVYSCAHGLLQRWSDLGEGSQVVPQGDQI